MRMWCVRIESEQITIRLRGTRREGPCPQFARPWQPLRRDRLDSSPGPLGGDHRQPDIDRCPDQRGEFFGSGDLSGQPRLGDHLGKRVSPPQVVDDHRQPSASPDRHGLACRGEHSGEVGDRRRHRLSGEKGQLAHGLTVELSDRRPDSGDETNENTPVRRPDIGPVGGVSSVVDDQMERTPVACGPLGLCPTSNSTF